VFVPIKIIVTADAEVTNLITKGTNRQTEVKVEAFESLNPFQKELEEFYGTFGKDKECAPTL
jgi:AIPR protein